MAKHGWPARRAKTASSRSFEGSAYGDLLDIDFLNSSYQSDTESAIAGPADRVASQFDVSLPYDQFAPFVGKYSATVKGISVQVEFAVIRAAADDILNAAVTQMPMRLAPHLTADMSPTCWLDSRGEYPVILATVRADQRVAHWAEPSANSSADNFEESEVVGYQPDKDKVFVLVAINSIIRKLEKPVLMLRHDDISLVLMQYFYKSSWQRALHRILLVSTPTAFRDVVLFHLAGSRSVVREWLRTTEEFSQGAQVSSKIISDENDLYDVIESFVNSVIRHEIEDRRWTDAFWDYQRNGNRIIKRTPKAETNIQPSLHVLMNLALKPLGISSIAESREGAGLLDFRFCYTTQSGRAVDVAMECKLAHHGEIEKGLKSQLVRYLRALKSRSGIYLVFWFKDGNIFKKPEKYSLVDFKDWPKSLSAAVSLEHGFRIDSHVIDASLRDSASKLDAAD